MNIYNRINNSSVLSSKNLFMHRQEVNDYRQILLCSPLSSLCTFGQHKVQYKKTYSPQQPNQAHELLHKNPLLNGVHVYFWQGKLDRRVWWELQRCLTLKNKPQSICGFRNYLRFESQNALKCLHQKHLRKTHSCKGKQHFYIFLRFSTLSVLVCAILIPMCNINSGLSFLVVMIVAIQLF